MNKDEIIKFLKIKIFLAFHLMKHICSQQVIQVLDAQFLFDCLVLPTFYILHYCHNYQMSKNVQHVVPNIRTNIVIN